MALVAGLTACSQSSANDAVSYLSSPAETTATGSGIAATTAQATVPAMLTTGSTSSATSTSGSSSSAASSTTSTTSTSQEPALPPATLTATPAFGSVNISPTAPITVSVTDGKLTDFTLTNPEGKQVAGAISADGTSWSVGEVLGYGKTYTATGNVTGSDGAVVPISGTYATVAPKGTARTTISPTDGEVVGVAAVAMITFGVEPADRAAIEKGITITTSPAVEGAWAWIQHDGGLWALDYRPKTYWPAGTQVHVEANVYGLDFGGGYWGRADVATDFSIGRNQVVIADVNSHELVVQQDGVTVATYPASFGRGGGDNDDLTTRSGIHVVTEFFDTKLMSNPRYGYTNIPEKWAVRISNNGEFIHANPASTDAQGSTNVTHGCVNLSLTDAKTFYDSSLFGDPVEVSGTDVQLSPSDGDIYDWTIDWGYWKTLSGLNV